MSNPFDVFDGHRFDPWEPPRNLGQALRPLLREGLTPGVLIAIEAHASTFLGPGWKMSVDGGSVSFSMSVDAREDGA